MSIELLEQPKESRSGGGGGNFPLPDCCMEHLPEDSIPIPVNCSVESPGVSGRTLEHLRQQAGQRKRMCAQLLSCVRLFVTPWTVACQASLSTRFARQEYWSGLPFPPPGDLSYPGIKPASPALGGRFFTVAPPEKPKGREFIGRRKPLGFVPSTEIPKQDAPEEDMPSFQRKGQGWRLQACLLLLATPTSEWPHCQGVGDTESPCLRAARFSNKNTRCPVQFQS